MELYSENSGSLLETAPSHHFMVLDYLFHIVGNRFLPDSEHMFVLHQSAEAALCRERVLDLANSFVLLVVS